MEENENSDFLGIQLQYDASGFFIMNFLDGQKAVFQVKMNPESFQNFSNDMIKIVKNYNLYQAQEYLERKNAENQKPECLPDTNCTDRSSENEPEQPKSDS